MSNYFFGAMPARANTQPSLLRSSSEAAELVSRYPDLTGDELAHLIEMFPRLPAVDVALMLSDEVLAPRLNAFSRDHRSKLRTPFREYAVFVAIAFVGIVVTAWAASVAS